MILRATLYGTDTGERQMLFEHLELLGENDLLVLDRGYPASWLMAALQARGIRFYMRIDGTDKSNRERVRIQLAP